MLSSPYRCLFPRSLRYQTRRLPRHLRERGSLEIPGDGEYGGEVVGRLVWEAYEEALKVWEKENPASEEDVKRDEERKREQEKVVDEVSPY